MPGTQEPTADPAAGRSHPPSPEDTIEEIRVWLVDEVARLERESTEIDMLLLQTRTEVERHEARRVKAQGQVKELERDRPEGDPEILKTRDQLVGIIGRSTLMEAQKQVLEGKQKTLERYRERMVALGETMEGRGDRPTATGARAGTAAGTSSVVSNGARSRGRGRDAALDVMRAQEDLRREIARQMHDGPAQSLSNIALQAEIVQRLMVQDPKRAAEEIEHLRATVQHALEATKTFIFDVRPMVLDDLGLVPTLRRAATDRGRRASVTVTFDSVGADQRLSPDVESAFFRIVDDALVGYLSLRPSAVSIRLDWTSHELRATIGGGRPEERVADARASAEARKADTGDLPPALAQMIEAQRAGEHQVWASARTLPPERWRDIRARAEAAGVAVELVDEGQTLEAVAQWGSPAEQRS